MNADRSPLGPDATTDVPLLADRYRLLGKLGQGGMGTVFLGLDTKLHREVAVKVLPPGSVHDADAVARFRREARALAKLSHPNIVQAHDSGQDGDRHFLVMEHVEGQSLAAVLREKGRITPTVAAGYAHQAALALQHAHEHGLVHRDVKPSNLLLTGDGTVKLLDLGLARFLQDQIADPGLTREGVGMGTPDYASPEQFREARKADARSDVYSLGCTLFTLIAGRVPFPGSSLSEKMEAHEKREPPPLEELCPEVPAGLALGVQKMMSKRPADRFQTAAEAAEALAPYVAGSSASFARIRNTSTWEGSRLGTMPDMRRRVRSVLPAVITAAAALVVVAAGVTASATGWLRFGGPEVVQGPAPTQPEQPPPGPAPPDSPPKKEEPAKPVPPEDPDVLTVSQQADAARYHTIGEALNDVKPGQTVRVLDAEVYPESFTLTQPSRFRGVTIEAVRGATLAPTADRRAVLIRDVPGVTVRGFRLKAGPGMGYLIGATGDVGGALLEGLEFVPGGHCTGVALEGVRGTEDAPVVVRGCTFRDQNIGVMLNGLSAPGKPNPCGVVVIRDNLFAGGEFGVAARGALHDIAVIGNRITGTSNSGLYLTSLTRDTKSLLVANNTFFEDARGVQLFDDASRTEFGERVALRNNLFLACPSDVVFLDSGGTASEIRGKGDGAEVRKHWRVDHNWREGPGDRPEDEGRVPVGDEDVARTPIEVSSRTADAADFLRPAAASPLATAGAGGTDPTLPRYVGALPPEGVEPWDWDRAAKMPADAPLLLVSQDPKDGAKYTSIGAALQDVTRPWSTVRVLDRAEYRETVTLTDAAKYEGLTLEAVNGATLVLDAKQRRLVSIEAVPRVKVSGFELRSEGALNQPGRGLVAVSGDAPGVRLAGLTLRPGQYVLGVRLFGARGTPAEPIRVTRCLVQGEQKLASDGIHLAAPDREAPTRYVVVEDNRVAGRGRGVWMSGHLANVQVTGNVVWNCAMTGLQFEDLAEGSGGILLANNTALGCRECLRVHSNTKGRTYREGQVEVLANLFFDAGGVDVATSLESPEGIVPAENGELLARLWTFRHNWRDGSGNISRAFAVPRTDGDHLLRPADLESTSAERVERIRPVKGQALAAGGAGPADPYLPAYAGALPPDGAAPWDWAVTWRSRGRPRAEAK